jgi:lysyl-tRNA synthetase class 2
MIETVCGRISSIRKHGKTTFIDIREEHFRLQIALKSAAEEVPYRRGDIIGAKGKAFITKKGELSLLL